MTQTVCHVLMDFIRNLDPGNATDDNLTPDVDLYDGGYLDSFTTVELIEFTQRTFGVDLSSADFYEGPLRNVNGIAANIEKAMATR